MERNYVAPSLEVIEVVIEDAVLQASPVVTDSPGFEGATLKNDI